MSEIAVRNVESAIVECAIAESARGDVDDLSERVVRDDAGVIDDATPSGRHSCRPRRRSNGAALNTTGPPPSVAKPSRIPRDLTAAQLKMMLALF
jgi:hypothetical protein